FFFSSRRRHTILVSDWSSDVCSSDLPTAFYEAPTIGPHCTSTGRKSRGSGTLGQLRLANQLSKPFDDGQRKSGGPVWMALQKDQALVTQIRESLTKLAADPSDSPCSDWLDKREYWADKCFLPVERWLQGSRKAIQSELEAADTNIKILSSKQDIPEGLVPMQMSELGSFQIKADRPSVVANIRSFAQSLRRH